MASRMDRYYNSSDRQFERSDKNKSLYRQIEDLDSYSNIKAVATIENTNEVDITKIKELLKNRENYKKEKKYYEVIDKQDSNEELPNIEYDEDKIYDIKDALDKAKVERKENLDKSSNQKDDLKNTQYNILKSLQLKDKDYTEDKELQKLINSITTNSKSNKESENSDLLDDLKSNTVVGDADSIQNIIESEKKKYNDTSNVEMDNSFYTSSLGFTKNDFDDLKDIKHSIKKNNLLIKILILSILIIFIGCGIYFLLF